MWIWQQPDWPRLTWSVTRMAQAEAQFLLGAGVTLGAVEHLDEEGRDNLVVQTLGEEATTTSRIEGEVLDRASVQSSVRRQLGLPTASTRATPAERGIAEVMVDLYRHAEAPLDDETLFRWHRMLMQGRSDVSLGEYRTHDDPMQIVSGRPGKQTIHFVAPPSSQIPAEMARFFAWFERTSPAGSEPIPAVTRAAVAHLYFECIHPFEDGNGRIGRAISERALSQSLGRPTLTGLAATILERRREYYDALEASNKNTEITEWVAWFAGITLEAQHRTQAHIEFLIEKARLLDRLRGQLNARQEKALLRMFQEGPKGFEGGLSAGNYIAITGTSAATARRDLGELVSMGALSRTGDRRGARYHLPLQEYTPRRVTVAGSGAVVTEPGA